MSLALATRRKATGVLAGRPLWVPLGLLLLGVTLLAVVIGPAEVDLRTTIQLLASALTGGRLDGWLTEVEAWQAKVLWELRLPRVATALLVGASLAVSGAVLQSLFRNPLASPSILGVSSGASLGAVIAIFFGLAAINVWALPLFSFLGAGLTIAVVYRIATARGHVPMGTLLLAGIAVGAFNVAMISLVLALALQHWEVGKSIVYWTMGGLDGRGWHHVLLLLPVFLASVAAIVFYQRDLDILLVGEIHANSVGVDVVRVRRNLLLVTAALTGVAVSVAGGIGFVGLVVPHITRLLVGPQHRRLLPVTCLLGALVLVSADLLIRGDASRAVIPLGVVTAAMGAPFFLFLLLRQRRLMQL
ncbi:MAG: iron ABC transporter permease [Pseudomonadota bacterium]